MVLRDSELLIALPNTPQGDRGIAPEDLAAAYYQIECETGIVAVAFDPPRMQTPGGLLIPETGANLARMEADIERCLDALCEHHAQKYLQGLDPSEKRARLNAYREFERQQAGLGTDTEYSGGAQERLRPDCGTIISYGDDPAFPDPRNLGQVGLGMRVLTRPYHGLCMEKVICPSGLFVKDVRFYGLTWEIEHSLLMCYDRRRGWVPMYDWVLIQRDDPSSEILKRRIKEPFATVISAGPSADVKEGDHILITETRNATLSFKWGMLEYELIKQIDDRGNYQIYGVIDPS